MQRGDEHLRRKFTSTTTTTAEDAASPPKEESSLKQHSKLSRRQRGDKMSLAAVFTVLCSMTVVAYLVLLHSLTMSSIHNNDNNSNGANPEKALSSSLSHAQVATSTAADKSTLVECHIPTPHSSSPTKAANGVLRITVWPNNHCGGSDGSGEYFLDLVRQGYYDQLYTFRVVPNFVVQWGFAPGKKAPPNTHKQQTTTTVSNKTTATATATSTATCSRSNTRGTLTMVKNSAQVFLNMGNNARLDKEGTLPFASIDEISMTKVAQSIYSGYKPGQGQIPAIRNDQVALLFPEMSRVDSCRIVST